MRLEVEALEQARQDANNDLDAFTRCPPRRLIRVSPHCP